MSSLVQKAQGITSTNRGARWDLVLVQGVPFGPMTLRLRNYDDTPIDLTGCDVYGGIRKDWVSPYLVRYDVAVEQTKRQEFDISLTADAARVLSGGQSIVSPAGRHVHDIVIVDSLGWPREMVRGQVIVLIKQGAV